MGYVYLEMGSGARVLPPPCGEAVEPRRSRRGYGGGAATISWFQNSTYNCCTPTGSASLHQPPHKEEVIILHPAHSPLSAEVPSSFHFQNQSQAQLLL